LIFQKNILKGDGTFKLDLDVFSGLEGIKFRCDV